MVPAPINSGSGKLIKNEMIRLPVRTFNSHQEEKQYAVEWDVISLWRADAHPLRDKSLLAPFGF
jgi:hypothetical protein